MTTMDKQEFLLGALIGGVVGAAAALMFAPVSGSHLREQLADGLGHLNGVEPKRKSAAHARPKKAVHQTAPKKKSRAPSSKKAQAHTEHL